MRQNLFIWTVFMPEIASDPRNYFKFQSCQRCFHKPCDRLRFGGVFPDKFFIINDNYLGIGFFDCPFIAESFDEIERLIGNVSFSEFLFNFNEVLGTLTPSERLHFRQENFVSDYSDVAGRVQFIKALWENRVISVIRIPGTFSLDAKMRKWLFANEGLSYMYKKPELDNGSDGAAVTDSLVGADDETSPQDATDDQQDQDQEKDQDKETTVKKLIQLIDEHGNPVPGANYQILVDDAVIAQGQLDATGKAEVEIKTDKDFSVKFLGV
jgi:hypothetical protein